MSLLRGDLRRADPPSAVRWHDKSEISVPWRHCFIFKVTRTVENESHACGSERWSVTEMADLFVHQIFDYAYCWRALGGLQHQTVESATPEGDTQPVNLVISPYGPRLS